MTDVSIGLGRFMLGDCMERMSEIEDASVDMILCDLPYGTTACKWDAVLPHEQLWAEYSRIAKKNAAIVLTASMPFTAALVASNFEMFKYAWVWEKSKASNFLLAKKQPLKAHEDVLIFSSGTPPYLPQMGVGKPFKGEGRSKKGSEWDGVSAVPNPTFRNDNEGARYPRSVQYFKTAESEGRGKGIHPTQKPVALFEYLIRTYTDEGMTVLDNCAGSGTTAIAAERTGRNWICIERDHEYYAAACNRVKSEIESRGMFA